MIRAGSGKSSLQQNDDALQPIPVVITTKVIIYVTAEVTLVQ